MAHSLRGMQGGSSASACGERACSPRPGNRPVDYGARRYAPVDPKERRTPPTPVRRLDGATRSTLPQTVTVRGKDDGPIVDRLVSIGSRLLGGSSRVGGAPRGSGDAAIGYINGLRLRPALRSGRADEIYAAVDRAVAPSHRAPRVDAPARTPKRIEPAKATTDQQFRRPEGTNAPAARQTWDGISAMSMFATTPPNPLVDGKAALMDTIRDLPLRNYFARATLLIAERLAANAAAWTGPLAWHTPAGGCADALECEISDSECAGLVVTVHLYPLFGRLEVASDCRCGQPRCAHAAALLLRLQRLSAWPRRMTPVQRWRRGLETLSDRPMEFAATPSRELRRVRCTLDADSRRRPSVLIARLLVSDDRDAPEGGQRWVDAGTLSDQSRLPPQTRVWLTQLATLERDASEPSCYRLKGHVGAALLEDWLRAGICEHARSHAPVSLGGARDPKWRWTIDEQGEARIGLQDPDGDIVRMIDLDGLRYLDEVSGAYGELRLAMRTWEMLARLPPIPPDEIALREEWPPHRMLSGVPPPPPCPAIREIRATPHWILVIGASRHPEGDYVFHLRAWAQYEGCRIALATDPWRATIVRHMRGEYLRIVRDLDEEFRHHERLLASGFGPIRRSLGAALRTLTPAPDAAAMSHEEHFRGGADTFAALDRVVTAVRPDEFLIEYDPDLPFSVLPGETTLRASLHEDDRPGWTQFDIAAVADHGEINVLPLILDGLSRKAFSLIPARNEPADARWLAPLGRDRFLPLPLSMIREWLSPLIEFVDKPPALRGGRVSLNPSQTIAISERLRQQDIETSGAAATIVGETLALLRSAAGSAAPMAPSSFRGNLREYQLNGLAWLQSLRAARLGGVLADDMGLGKTVQIIAHLAMEMECGRLEKPALVVAPTSLMFNWQDEIGRFAPELRCFNFAGTERGRRERLDDAHVVLISYAMLTKELPSLSERDFSLVVMDEAQWIKNPETLSARAVRRIRAAHRVAVTGTPIENHLGELWAHFDAVMPGYLGDRRSFQRTFREPIESRQDDRRLAILRERIAPFMLRRNKSSVAPELPSKSETLIRVGMDDAQRRLYESLRLSMSETVRAALAEYSDERTRIVVLSALLKLRQACCDPRLLGGTGATLPPSGKLAALLDLVRTLRNERRQVLVFSQFTSMLELIAAELRRERLTHGMLTGASRDRRTIVRKFQSGETPILLASLKAGGVGINLTAADAVIHYEPWWNPAVELQAVDRAHRLGQEHPVFIYKLICNDSIEEKIEDLKERKSDISKSTLDQIDSAAHGLSKADICALFGLDADG